MNQARPNVRPASTSTRTRRRGALPVVVAVLLVVVAGCVQSPAPAGSPTTPAPARSTNVEAASEAEKPFLRFAVASDGHYSASEQSSHRQIRDLVRGLTRWDTEQPLDFVVINGDITDGGPTAARGARAELGALTMPVHVTIGNHDRLSRAQWQAIWATSANFVERDGDRSIILVSTSDKAGAWLCADQAWLEAALQREARQRDVFVFMHITPNTWTPHGRDCPGIRRLLASSDNVRAVFNGHDHDETDVKFDEGVPYFFDAHYGGTWGTRYRAFRVVEVYGDHLATHLVLMDGSSLSTTVVRW